MPTNACAFCGVMFDATPKSRVKIKRGELLRFCSVACRNRHNTKQLRKSEPRRFLAEPDPASFIRECGVCKKTFDATPPKPRYDKPHQYCSKTCRDIGRGQKVRRRVAKVCKHCGKTFEILRAWDKNKDKHTGQFCSHECNYAYQREHITHRRSSINDGQPKLNSQGYVVVHRPWHDGVAEARKNGETSTYAKSGRILEHRYVMEKILKRRLLQTETPHHLNGNRADNRPENLELWVKSQPSGQRISDLIAYVVQYHRTALLEELSHHPL